MHSLRHGAVLVGNEADDEWRSLEDLRHHHLRLHDAMEKVGFFAAGDALEDIAGEAKAAVARLDESLRNKMLLVMRERMKGSATGDPDMPGHIKSAVDCCVDGAWYDLYAWLQGIDKEAKAADLQGDGLHDYARLATLGAKPTTCSPRWVRAWVLYHFLPFDRTFFGQLKDPAYLFLLMLSLITFWCIRIVFFTCLLIFLVTGRRIDTSSLVNYIISFKGKQFISSGVVLMAMAGWKYQLCVHKGGEHSCDEDGPGVTTNMVFSTIDLVGSCALVWAAFLTLPFSQAHDGMPDREQPADPPAQKRWCCGENLEYHRRRSGRLRHLLIYDLLCFALMCGILVYLSVSDIHELGLPTAETKLQAYMRYVQTPRFKRSMYMARTFYALMSLPFLAFSFPGLSILARILTHSTSTGYNRHGVCVPFTFHPADPPAGKQSQ